MSRTGFLIVISFLCVFESYQKQLPNYIRKCSLKHNLRECAIKSANDAIPFIVKGDPAYDIPNLSPLRIPFMSLIKTKDMSLNLTDVNIQGLDQAKLIDFVPANVDKMLFDIVLAIPKVTINADYSIDGKIMIMPVNAKGRISLFLNNGVYTYTVVIKAVEINGENHYQIEGQKLEFRFDKISSDLESLTSTDETIGSFPVEQVNELLNENWNTLLRDFGPLVSDAVSSLIQQIMNGIARDVPANGVFLPD
ncbi:hypothetical protein HHI36_012620 [Cryptolaemus montrouzieri]|uniref:Uncharacterized protein n=1 Tax=Cryptolaemus montrouzieri TaxID=559131 RepID=A0ABD2NFD0_9CUCU